MTNQTPESVIAEVIEYHADDIDTHGPGCYKNHAACMAVKLRDMLREPGKSDVATEELARIKPLFENYSREYPNECNKRVKAEAERDAALAAIERVRALETFSITDSYPAWTAVDHDDLLAALDEAPEPEWEERLAACDKHGTHCWSCKRYTERRRPAGEWHRLPVEGESNANH